MLNEFEKELERYLKQIRELLICDKNTKNDFINDLREDILCYAKDNSIDEIDDIVHRFGTAEEVAKDFLMKMNIHSINKKVKTKNTVIAAVIALVIMAAIGIAVATVYEIKAARNRYDVMASPPYTDEYSTDGDFTSAWITEENTDIY